MQLVDLSVKTSARAYINPEVDLNRDLSLYFETKTRLNRGDLLQTAGIEIVTVRPPLPQTILFVPDIAATHALPVFHSEFIQLVVLL